MDISILKNLGFSDKSAVVYMALLQQGPSSVRALAEHTGLNRGTVYDILNWLKERGVADFYRKDTRQQFVAAHPDKLLSLYRERETELEEAGKKLGKSIPELEALYAAGGNRPVARYYEGQEIAEILRDVLRVCASQEEKMYRIYSTEGVREYLYRNFPSFSDERVAAGIRVRAIAIGSGGELRGLDERKWIAAKSGTPTYIILYHGKSAYISLNAHTVPVGVVIENDGVYETQQGIFDAVWNTL